MTKEKDKKSFVLGKDKGPNKTEKIYSADEVREKIPFLSAKNAQGYNIYITPIDSQHHYNVIDDMDENNLHKLTESGYTPCLIQESSFKNYQAILKTQKHESSKKEQSAANKFVGKINKNYGDPEFSGVVHPFRMSGFANRKEKYKDDKGNYPFTKIHYAKHTLCNKAAEQIQKERDTLKQEIQVRYTKEANKRREKIQNEAEQKPGLYKDVDKDYMRARHKIERLAEEKGWVKDDSVIDFRASLELLDRYNEEEIKGAIMNNSPAIEHRHNNIYDYAERTVDKAAQKHEEQLQQQMERYRGPEMEM